MGGERAGVPGLRHGDGGGDAEGHERRWPSCYTILPSAFHSLQATQKRAIDRFLRILQQTPLHVQGNGGEKNIPRRATEAVLVVAESIVVGFNQSLVSWLGYFAD